jgi:thiol-disulfide isomerase/thioredoxin
MIVLIVTYIIRSRISRSLAPLSDKSLPFGICRVYARFIIATLPALFGNCDQKAFVRSSMSAVHAVKSPQDFQSLLSKDLTRVSLINFWAQWAKPCAEMNRLVEELSHKYPQVLVLQVRY